MALNGHGYGRDNMTSGKFAGSSGTAKAEQLVKNLKALMPVNRVAELANEAQSAGATGAEAHEGNYTWLVHNLPTLMENATSCSISQGKEMDNFKKQLGDIAKHMGNVFKALQHHTLPMQLIEAMKKLFETKFLATGQHFSAQFVTFDQKNRNTIFNHLRLIEDFCKAGGFAALPAVLQAPHNGFGSDTEIAVLELYASFRKALKAEKQADFIDRIIDILDKKLEEAIESGELEGLITAGKEIKNLLWNVMNCAQETRQSEKAWQSSGGGKKGRSQPTASRDWRACKLTLTVAHNLLKSNKLDIRRFGASLVNNVVRHVKEGGDQSGEGGGAGQAGDQNPRAKLAGDLKKWMVDEDLLKVLFNPESIHEEVLKATNEMFAFIVKTGMSDEQIQLVWETSKTARTNIKPLFEDYFDIMAAGLNFESMDHLFKLITADLGGNDETARIRSMDERTLKLVARLNEHAFHNLKKNQMFHTMISQAEELLWEQIEKSQNRNLKKLASSSLGKIISQCTESGSKERNNLLRKCIQNLQKERNPYVSSLMSEILNKCTSERSTTETLQKLEIVNHQNKRVLLTGWVCQHTRLFLMHNSAEDKEALEEEVRQRLNLLLEVFLAHGCSDQHMDWLWRLLILVPTQQLIQLSGLPPNTPKVTNTRRRLRCGVNWFKQALTDYFQGQPASIQPRASADPRLGEFSLLEFVVQQKMSKFYQWHEPLPTADLQALFDMLQLYYVHFWQKRGELDNYNFVKNEQLFNLPEFNNLCNIMLYTNSSKVALQCTRMIVDLCKTTSKQAIPTTKEAYPNGFFALMLQKVTRWIESGGKTNDSWRRQEQLRALMLLKTYIEETRKDKRPKSAHRELPKRSPCEVLSHANPKARPRSMNLSDDTRLSEVRRLIAFEMGKSPSEIGLCHPKTVPLSPLTYEDSFLEDFRSDNQTSNKRVVRFWVKNLNKPGHDSKDTAPEIGPQMITTLFSLLGSPESGSQFGLMSATIGTAWEILNELPTEDWRDQLKKDIPKLVPKGSPPQIFFSSSIILKALCLGQKRYTNPEKKLRKEFLASLTKGGFKHLTDVLLDEFWSTKSRHLGDVTFKNQAVSRLIELLSIRQSQLPKSENDQDGSRRDSGSSRDKGSDQPVIFEYLTGREDKKRLMERLVEAVKEACHPFTTDGRRLYSPFKNTSETTNVFAAERVLKGAFKLMNDVLAKEKNLWETVFNGFRIRDVEPGKTNRGRISDALVNHAHRPIRDALKVGILEICKCSDALKDKFTNFFSNILETCCKRATGTEANRMEQFFELLENLFSNEQAGKKSGAKAKASADDATPNEPGGDSIKRVMEVTTGLIMNHEIVEKTDRDKDILYRGLLKLAKRLVEIDETLKTSFGKCLVKEIFAKGLFTLERSTNKLWPVKCKNPVTRKEAFEFLKTLCRNHRENTMEVFALVKDLLGETLKKSSKEIQEEEERGETEMKNVAVGLVNLGNTCYLNALLQQLHYVPGFSDSLLKTHKITKEESKDEDTLDPDSEEAKEEMEKKKEGWEQVRELQLLCLHLKESYRQAYDPINFCRTVKDNEGNRIDLEQQNDPTEFYQVFFDQFEENLKSTTNPNLVNETFEGQTVSEVKCLGCNHISPTAEKVWSINLEVKGQNDLETSLGNFVKPEAIDYKCEKCNQKGSALKSMSIKKAPNNFLIILKRVGWDYSTMLQIKCNERFEFGDRLNIEPFTTNYLHKHPMTPGLPLSPAPDRERNKDFEYELTGIMIHSGEADRGHYYSFAKNTSKPDSKEPAWLRLDDARVSALGKTWDPDECFGGHDEIPQGYGYGQKKQVQRTRNAYVLLYRKVEQPATTPPSEVQLDPPSHIVENRESIMRENIKFFRDRSLYDQEFENFITQCLKARQQDAEETVYRASTLYMNEVLCRRNKSSNNHFQNLLKATKPKEKDSGWLLEQFAKERPHWLRTSLVRAKQTMRRFTKESLDSAIRTLEERTELGTAPNPVVVAFFQECTAVIKGIKVGQTKTAKDFGYEIFELLESYLNQSSTKTDTSRKKTLIDAGILGALVDLICEDQSVAPGIAQMSGLPTRDAPYFEYTLPIHLICILLRSTLFTPNGETPTTFIGDGPVELTPGLKRKIGDGPKFWHYLIARTTNSKDNPTQTIASHLTAHNPAIAKIALNEVLERFRDLEFDEFRTALQAAKGVLRGQSPEFVKEHIQMFYKVAENNSEYSKSTDAFMNWILNLAGSAPAVKKAMIELGLTKEDGWMSKRCQSQSRQLSKYKWSTPHYMDQQQLAAKNRSMAAFENSAKRSSKGANMLKKQWDGLFR